MGQALRLASNFVVMKDDFEADVVAVGPSLHQCLDAEFDGCKGRLLISSRAFDADWPSWERHPAGDEFIILVSGDADMRISTAAGIDTTRMTEPGTFVIVPRGAWHTARIRRPSVMLFVTPGEGTEIRATPEPGGALHG